MNGIYISPLLYSYLVCKCVSDSAFLRGYVVYRVTINAPPPPPRHLIAVLITPRSRSVQVYTTIMVVVVGTHTHNVPERFKFYRLRFRDAKETMVYRAERYYTFVTVHVGDRNQYIRIVRTRR